MNNSQPSTKTTASGVFARLTRRRARTPERVFAFHSEGPCRFIITLDGVALDTVASSAAASAAVRELRNGSAAVNPCRMVGCRIEPTPNAQRAA